MRDEEEFLKAYDPAKFERPSVAVDLVLMSVHEKTLHALLMLRAAQPAKGKWALPGGFVRMTEDLDAAAKRVLKEKAHLESAYLEQLYSFGAVDRDPRTRVISVAYFALLPEEKFSHALKSASDLALARITTTWTGESGGPAEASTESEGTLDLAFDHADILGLAVKRLRGKLDYSDIAFALLPRQFTLRELQDVHEAILGVRYNKPAFRRRMLDKKILKATGHREEGVTFRPAELYRFSKAQKGNFHG